MHEAEEKEVYALYGDGYFWDQQTKRQDKVLNTPNYWQLLN